MSDYWFWALSYLSCCFAIGWIIGNSDVLDETIADAELMLKIAWCHIMVAASCGQNCYTITVIRNGKVKNEIHIGGE